MTTAHSVQTLDLNFLNCPQAIASYLLPHAEGLILFESGPGSTQEQLQKNLEALGYSLNQLTHLFLTHIHLDHAGAAGWLAEQTGAIVHVHPRGAPHLLDPTRLLASAARIYQDQMDYLWGEFKPVPDDQLVILDDGDEVQIGSYVIRALDTPGHANHHLAYLVDGICFSGDVGGVRIQNAARRHLRLPMPPPEFHPPRWRDSIAKLKKERITQIAPTHFGFYDDVEWHLDELLAEMDQVEEWMASIMPRGLEIDQLRKVFLAWVHTRAQESGLEGDTIDAFEKANPSGMSADGIKRYWEKYVQSA